MQDLNATIQRIIKFINYFSMFNSIPTLEEIDYLIFEKNEKIFKEIEKKFVIKEGFVSLKEKEYLIEEEIKYFKFNLLILNLAIKIGNFLINKNKNCIMCITGSVSFLRARKNHDIDYLMLTEKDNLWYNLFKMFILIKILKIKGLKFNVCINFATNFKSFLEHINKEKKAIVAFDIIKSFPINRKEEYYYLINKIDWINKYFKINKKVKVNFKILKEKIKIKTKILNIFFFIILYFYLKLINLMRKIKLKKEKKYNLTYNYEISLEKYIIMSDKYKKIGEKLEEVFK